MLTLCLTLDVHSYKGGSRLFGSVTLNENRTGTSWLGKIGGCQAIALNFFASGICSPEVPITLTSGILITVITRRLHRSPGGRQPVSKQTVQLTAITVEQLVFHAITVLMYKHRQTANVLQSDRVSLDQ